MSKKKWTEYKDILNKIIQESILSEKYFELTSFLDLNIKYTNSQTRINEF